VRTSLFVTWRIRQVTKCVVSENSSLGMSALRVNQGQFSYKEGGR